ncbi:MAG: thiamine-phosphate kinase [Gemmatimonadota bacterium]
MTEPLTTRLAGGSEFDRIRAIARALGPAASGLGDDCAIVTVGAETLALSTDTSVDTVHFRRAWLEPREIGWRAAAAALSDLAAVGAEVIGVLVAVTVPASEPESVTVDVMRGVGEATMSVGGRVLGGDLSRGDTLSIGVTVVGRVDRPIRRSGAAPGDRLWVTGSVGAARAALVAWEHGVEPEPAWRAVFAKPAPRIGAARWLAGHGARAMIDLSDGIASDAAHLAAANVLSVEIELESLPMADGIARAAELAGEAPQIFAALGGEDYELLVALPPEFGPGDAARFTAAAGIPLTPVGTFSKGQAGVRLVWHGSVLELHGYDHFA